MIILRKRVVLQQEITAEEAATYIHAVRINVPGELDVYAKSRHDQSMHRIFTIPAPSWVGTMTHEGREDPLLEYARRHIPSDGFVIIDIS